MSNINVTPGTGKTVATETINSVEYGLVKLVDGTSGATISVGTQTAPLIVNLATNSVNVTSISTVSIGNSPAVTLASGSGVYKVDGSAYTQPVSGTVTANAGTGTFTVDGSGVTQPISATSLPTISVGNYPATQAVSLASGSGVYKVDGSAYTQPISATSLPTVSVGNFPTTQAISGTISVGNNVSVTTQATVSIGNSPTVQGSLSVQLGGWSIKSLINLTSVTTVSVASGKYAGGSFINLNSTPAYLQFFDTSSAINLGSTVPSFVQPIPANASGSLGSAFVLEITQGVNVTNALKVAATTTATGSTVVTTGLIGHVLYR